MAHPPRARLLPGRNKAPAAGTRATSANRIFCPSCHARRLAEWRLWLEELIARYDEAGIEKGAVLPIVSPEIYLPQANEDILDMRERSEVAGFGVR